MSNSFHLALPAGDLHKTEKFYTEILGCKTGNREKGKWVDIKNVVYIKKLREYYKKYNVKFYYTPAHKAQPDPRKDKEKYDQWYGNYMADHLAKCASQN